VSAPYRAAISSELADRLRVKHLFLATFAARRSCSRQQHTRREEWREVKLDPEERVIAAALNQVELDDASERGVSARIEFRREGYAKVTLTISRELVERARALDLTTGELFAEAIQLAVPGAFDLARPHLPRRL
jgi:hypothetical protein